LSFLDSYLVNRNDTSLLRVKALKIDHKARLRDKFEEWLQPTLSKILCVLKERCLSARW
jgi:hypothetical protein